MYSNSTAKINTFNKIRSKDVCGVKCTEEVNCVSFAYHETKFRCKIFSERLVNKTNTCYKKEPDYGEFVD